MKNTKPKADDGILRLLAGSMNPFLWVTHKGKVMELLDMATPHLFYTVRMLFNHSVPPVFRVGEFKRYPDVPNWPIRYRRAAVASMRKELSKRDDIEDYMRDEMCDMVANSDVIRALGLRESD